MSPRLGEVVLASQSDERLVKLASSGQERAFAVIVERYRPELSAFARRLNRDGKAEDIVQQAFLSAFAALGSGAEVKHLRGWLYRIVRNVAARSQAPQCMPLDGATASGESVEEVVQQRALAMDALAELARLPARQRQAMVGTALDGRGRTELATSMGVSEGAVRQLVHRARARIRTAVTALTPWPLVKALAAARPGSGATVNVTAGLGAASSAGVALKVGIVLASGALLTGVAAVDLRGGARRPVRAGPRTAARVGDARDLRADRQVAGDRVLAPAPIFVDSNRDSPTTRAVPSLARTVWVRDWGDHAAGWPQRRRQGGAAGSDRGSGAGSGWDDGAGGSRRGGGADQGRDGSAVSGPEAVSASDHGSPPGGERGGSNGAGSGSGAVWRFGSGWGTGSGDGGSAQAPGAGLSAGSAAAADAGTSLGPGAGTGSDSGSATAGSGR